MESVAQTDFGHLAAAAPAGREFAIKFPIVIGAINAWNRPVGKGAGRFVKQLILMVKLRKADTGGWMLDRISDNRHRLALQWFIGNSGQIVNWPEKIDGVLLATRAKGIYKPSWMEYALSVRQTLSSPYRDMLVNVGEGQSWEFQYHQEEQKGKQPIELFTNKGMLACLRDQIPVGVIVQTSEKPVSSYKVIGLALVGRFENGAFYLHGERR